MSAIINTPKQTAAFELIQGLLINTLNTFRASADDPEMLEAAEKWTQRIISADTALVCFTSREFEQIEHARSKITFECPSRIAFYKHAILVFAHRVNQAPTPPPKPVAKIQGSRAA